MQLPIQILVHLRLLLRRNGIKYLKNLFWMHANRFEGVDTIIEKMVAILNKFTILCLSSYRFVYFLKLKLIFLYNRVVYYYTRIFLILLPHLVYTHLDKLSPTRISIIESKHVHLGRGLTMSLSIQKPMTSNWLFTDKTRISTGVRRNNFIKSKYIPKSWFWIRSFIWLNLQRSNKGHWSYRVYQSCQKS